jgi:hypothetical protein
VAQFPFVQSCLLSGLPAESPAPIKNKAALLSPVNSDGGWGITPGTLFRASATGVATAEMCKGNPERHRGLARKAESWLLEWQRAD